MTELRVVPDPPDYYTVDDVKAWMTCLWIILIPWILVGGLVWKVWRMLK